MQKIIHRRNPNQVSEEEHSRFKSNINKIKDIKQLNMDKGLFVSRIDNHLFYTQNKKHGNELHITLLQVRSSYQTIKELKKYSKDIASFFVKGYTSDIIYNFIKDWITS